MEYGVSRLLTRRRFFKLNATLKALQTLKTLIRFDCAVSSEQKIITYFDVLRYIASFKGAELQFSPVLFGVRRKLLFDLAKLKLVTLISLSELSLVTISDGLKHFFPHKIFILLSFALTVELGQRSLGKHKIIDIS